MASFMYYFFLWSRRAREAADLLLKYKCGVLALISFLIGMLSIGVGLGTLLLQRTKNKTIVHLSFVVCGLWSWRVRCDVVVGSEDPAGP